MSSILSNYITLYLFSSLLGFGFWGVGCWSFSNHNTTKQAFEWFLGRQRSIIAFEWYKSELKQRD
jgi:hypothetical protein